MDSLPKRIVHSLLEKNDFNKKFVKGQIVTDDDKKEGNSTASKNMTSIFGKS
jgi:hypothetical protein